MGNCNVAGPNEVLVVSGGLCGNSKTYDHTGACRCSWWCCSSVERLSLNVITLEPTCQSVETKRGVALTVTGVAQVAVMSAEGSEGDKESERGDEPLKRAVEQFLGKSERDITKAILQTLEGHLRAILGTLEVEEVYSKREIFANVVTDTAAPDLKKMGLEILSFTIKDLRDDVNYLNSLGVNQTETVKSVARIGQANADRDAEVKVAESLRLTKVAQLETETVNANNKRKYDTAYAGFQEEVQKKKAEADIAYELQEYKMQQLIKKEEKEIEVVVKGRQIKVEDAEVLRKEKELQATVARPTEAERKRRELLAEADRFVTVEGAKADAEGIRVMGVANAAKTLAIGTATAKAISQQAIAYKAYGDAAVVEMIVEALPKIAAEIAAPLARTGDVVMLSGTDNGGMTGEITKLVSTLPPVVGALSGVDITKMMQSMA
eukprot:m.118827 g.118827  ORF g.118827 m.118827 type:complete len:436 (-) comp28701_c0_seq1:47-1354(-)